VRQRALIHIGGPPRAGKTTFIETALASAGERMIIAARCRLDDSLSQPRESIPKTDPELRRYLAAGACAAARYSFPAGDVAHDAFFMTSFMENYSNAVFLEGDNPISFVDVAIYVAPALSGGLLVRGKRDRTVKEQARVDPLAAVLRQPDGLDLLVERLLSGRMAGGALRPELVERLRSTPRPRSTMRWSIADGYRGIERAQLVVVNIRGEAEREKGEMLLAEVARLRKDRAVFDDVIGRWGSKVPITAVVANLSEPKDLGTKKAVARVRRVIRPMA